MKEGKAILCILCISPASNKEVDVGGGGWTAQEGLKTLPPSTQDAACR